MNRSPLVLPLLALILTALCACSAQGEQAAYDPSATAQALLDSGCFSQQLEALDADMAVPYLGLSAEPEEAAVYTSLEGGYEELAVLRMANEEDAKAAQDVLAAHVEAQRAAEADMQYKPGDLTKLENALVQRSGNTLLLVVADDYDKAQAALSP